MRFNFYHDANIGNCFNFKDNQNNMLERLGDVPNGRILERVKKSPNYIDGAFRNREKPTPDLRMKSPYKIMFDFIAKKRNVIPQQPIPTLYTDLNSPGRSDTPSYLWLGHSSYFIFWKNYSILVDPVLSLNASPLYKTNVAFEGTFIYSTSDIPEIDLLILTHDHFDHLDYYTIQQIHPRVRRIVCALGMESHLIFWGVNESKIISLDWDESFVLNDEISITALTTRHNSGRTTTRNQTLWAAYALQAGEFKLFLAGDGGYGKHFRKIGEKYGPFDFGTIENGQYNLSWPKNHMFPRQSVQAAIDLRLKIVAPIHWGKFALAMHRWNDPILKFVRLAEQKNIQYCVPKIGQLYTINQEPLHEIWWDFD